ncbi:hypothetical protein U9M48_007958 [Paspalum notatum var. saurae]|uniref:Uncharacterized protein n=1 Tax=Paspalum notatum var. saurae TaxID=547442 RepID=A0AAQ3SP12_PASNO
MSFLLSRATASKPRRRLLHPLRRRQATPSSSSTAASTSSSSSSSISSSSAASTLSSSAASSSAATSTSSPWIPFNPAHGAAPAAPQPGSRGVRRAHGVGEARQVVPLSPPSVAPRHHKVSLRPRLPFLLLRPRCHGVPLRSGLPFLLPRRAVLPWSSTAPAEPRLLHARRLLVISISSSSSPAARTDVELRG